MQNQSRVVFEKIYPQINNGDVFIKRVVNETVDVYSDIFADGHDALAASVLYKHEREKKWREVRMRPFYDTWKASFKVAKQGFYSYKIIGWIDYALNWQYGIKRKIEDNQNVSVELLEGVELFDKIFKLVSKEEKDYLKHLIDIFKNAITYNEAIQEAVSDKLYNIFDSYPEKKLANSSKELKVYVDRLKARFSTWYEFFPRSASGDVNISGTFKDCEELIPRVAKLGFDTLYFPPIHPIGELNRKGRNNTTTANKGDVGSCWAIGSKLGGHKDINPALGTIEDFKSVIKKASDYGIEIAMDYALQAAPDHPWVKDHPQWFKWRPDGTVQYAENPPKKYQDILPIYFETEDYKNLWDECLDILLFWIDCGINIFRVDNPHTKPFYFWNWIISKVKEKHPDVLFLAEAFTAKEIMQQLGKHGYTQSYTYFAWKNSKQELIDYVEDLTKSEQREYFRPNFWPNTPDINPFNLQGANESKYIQRYVLAATLSSNTGIYGPVFEQMNSDALPGREEYLNSEKFQICKYDWSQENMLTHLISKINNIRKHNEALQQTNNIKFCEINNDNLIAFYKWNDTKTNEILVVVNLDPYYMQQGNLQLPLHELEVWNGHHINVKDLITQSSYDWHQEWNFIELHSAMPFHIFEINK